MALMNHVGQHRMALSTLVSYPASHAYRDDGPGLLWNNTLHQLVELNADERERAMGFITGVTATASVSEASRRQVLGKAMDLNCLTWIVSLGLTKQRCLRVDLVIITPLVSSLPTETIVAMAGGDRQDICLPWSLWDVTRGLARVAAHADGEVSHEKIATKESTYTSSLDMKELNALIGPGIRIELASDTSIFRRPYQYSEMERDLIRSRTLDLLEDGPVELSHGEYSSATVMSVKKDVHDNYTDKRMCGDYRHFNWQTKSDKYAMLTPEEIFDVVGHARIFSTLDLRVGYHQLPACQRCRVYGDMYSDDTWRIYPKPKKYRDF
ncbi:hypothetical protein AXG93_4530s1280 [Marchantia polymorpha subsp. ruderalis]|uniref:Reverse transcriptase domain-containing protein n=1 Tax=Marchantia polymorpha subsp. ruderalis TaxID=1480154 RepID=A0A176VX13_MARPO|nr:hypothetical protein AXG93_4530s1280 [Marchantia polymorpha subsp. ruderalis]